MVTKRLCLNSKFNPFLIILAIILITSCTQIVNTIPKEFSGKWVETSDDIILQRAPPQYLSITNNKIIVSQINDEGEIINNVNTIELIERSSANKLTISCLRDKTLANEITLILKDGFIYADEYLHSAEKDGDESGMSNKIGRFYK